MYILSHMQSVYIHAYIQCVYDSECSSRLREFNCPWNYVVAAAAEEGHFDLLEWAQKNGCPWNARTCIAAAEMAHLTILQWARENGCP
jgi:hypothetical protein